LPSAASPAGLPPTVICTACPSLIAFALLIGVLVARLLDEENYLARHLKGYDDYRQKVRSRLVSGIW
jgi:protein-S-isoprenylcysteine O-methyltransferase Ste14